MGAAVRVGEVEDTLFRVVVTHLAVSPVVALVRDSAGQGDFPLKITAALMTVVSVTIVSFFNRASGLFIGLPTILTIMATWTTDRITTINMGTIQPRLCNRSPSEPPSALARSSASTQSTPGRWIQGPILSTSIAATVRAAQRGNKE